MIRARLRYFALVAVATLVVTIPTTSASAAPGPSDAPEWWFDSWQVPTLWAAGARGQGVTIAEIDTGVNAALPELAKNVLPGKDFGDPTLDGRTDHQLESFGHGTAMASLMVAQPGTAGITGLAPDAKLLPIAVPLAGTDDAVSGGSDHVNDAIRYAADSGAKVISLSLGGSPTETPGALPCPQPEQDAITYAISKGSIVVAASGNSGNPAPGQPKDPVEDPAVCLGVVSVGAVDQNSTVTSFSSQHPFLTVTAPGKNIPTLSRVPGVAYKGDGTSQSTAITSAALALIWSKYPTLTGRQIVARLLATLDHSSPVRDQAYGFGIINPEKAIDNAVPATAPDPVYAALDPFIARARAADATSPLPAVAPAATQPLPVASALVASAPSALTARVVTGIFVAIGGLVAFITLSIIGILRWRRRRQPPEPVPGIPYAALAYPAAPVGRNGQPEPTTTAPESGVVWHDVTDLEPSSPFPRGKVSKT